MGFAGEREAGLRQSAVPCVGDVAGIRRAKGGQMNCLMCPAWMGGGMLIGSVIGALVIVLLVVLIMRVIRS